jgi:hypothetical protein
MTTLIPKFGLKNGGATPTGAINRTIYGKLSDFISVKDFGAIGDGVANDTVAIQAALTYGGSLLVPAGTYKITADLIIGDNTNVTFASGSGFIAGANNITFFKSTTHAYGSQIRNAVLNGNGFTGVTGFSLVGFRLHAGLYDCIVINMTNGAIFDACFGTEVFNFTSFDGVPYPIRVYNNCAVLDIHNPNLDNETGIGAGTGTGIVVDFGTDVNTGVIISGGYIQGFVNGIIDRALATKIENTYFEANSNSDIVFSSARNSTVLNTVHSAAGGVSCFQATSSDAISVLYPMMVSGSRTGVFNFNNTNSNCTANITPSNASYNYPLGTISGILVSGNSQFFNVLDGSGAGLTFTQNATAYWSISNNVVTVTGDITYPVTASGANATLTLPIAAKVNSSVNGCVGFTTFGSILTMNGGSSGIGFYSPSGGGYTNANMSAKRVAFSITYIAN